MNHEIAAMANWILRHKDLECTASYNGYISARNSDVAFSNSTYEKFRRLYRLSDEILISLKSGTDKKEGGI